MMTAHTILSQLLCQALSADLPQIENRSVKCQLLIGWDQTIKEHDQNAAVAHHLCYVQRPTCTCRLYLFCSVLQPSSIRGLATP